MEYPLYLYSISDHGSETLFNFEHELQQLDSMDVTEGGIDISLNSLQ